MLVKKLDKRTGSAGRNHGSDSDSSSKYHCNDDTGQIRRNSARTKRRPGLSCNFLPQRIIRGTSKIGCHIKRASQTQPCDGRNQQQTALNKRQFSTTQSVVRRRKPVNQDSTNTILTTVPKPNSLCPVLFRIFRYSAIPANKTQFTKSCQIP